MAARGRSPPRPPHGTDRSLPTARDCRKYAREFQRIDRDQDGLITAQEAKTVFDRSGLGNEMLMRIWDLADVNRTNRLSFVEFVAAMHLVHRARVGVPPPRGGLSPDLVGFLGAFQASAAELSTQGHSRSASRSRSATPIGLRAPRSVPTQRDCRKYAREFQRIDRDVDGFVTAEEAKTVFVRSGLGGQALAQVLDLVDVSRRGRLGFIEFVAAMHLVGNARAGLLPPQPGMGLPPELVSFLGQFRESAAELALQGNSRSASRSRSQSPAPPSRHKLDALGAAPGMAPSPFDAQTSFSFDGGSPGRDLPEPFPEFADGLGAGDGKKKKKNKHHRDSDHDTGDRSTGAVKADLKSWEETPQQRRAEAAPPGRDPPRRLSPPRTRMGLRIEDPHDIEDEDLANGNGIVDQSYKARMREILGKTEDGTRDGHRRKVIAGSAPRRWYADSREGAFDPRGSLVGDYSSPVMRTVLMGATPTPDSSRGPAHYRAAESALLSPDAAPFLRTIVPNYSKPQSALGYVAVPSGGGVARSQPPALTATDAQQRFLSTYTSTSSARSLREQLHALPGAYKRDVASAV